MFGLVSARRLKEVEQRNATLALQLRSMYEENSLLRAKLDMYQRGKTSYPGTGMGAKDYRGPFRRAADPGPTPAPVAAPTSTPAPANYHAGSDDDGVPDIIRNAPPPFRAGGARNAFAGGGASGDFGASETVSRDLYSPPSPSYTSPAPSPSYDSGSSSSDSSSSSSSDSSSSSPTSSD